MNEQAINLFLLDPIDVLREKCKALNSQDLVSFARTHKRVYNVCKDIIAQRKREHEEWKFNYIQSYFDVRSLKRLTNSNLSEVIMFGDGQGNISIIVDSSAVSEELIQISNIGLIPSMDKYQIVIGPQRYMYRFNKHVMSLSDQYKIIKILNKYGYSEVIE